MFLIAISKTSTTMRRERRTRTVYLTSKKTTQPVKETIYTSCMKRRHTENVCRSKSYHKQSSIGPKKNSDVEDEQTIQKRKMEHSACICNFKYRVAYYFREVSVIFQSLWRWTQKHRYQSSDQSIYNAFAQQSNISPFEKTDTS